MPEPITLVTMGTYFAANAGTAVLKPFIEDLYKTAKGQVKTQLSNHRAAGRIASLFDKLGSVRLVKTIWQVDKEVDLMQFYHPTRLVVSQKKRIVTQLRDIPHKRNIVLEGIVGQGKSIFLRFLACREIVNGDRVPLFIELRKLAGTRPVMSAILAKLDDLGFEGSEELFEHLATTGSAVLMLDAFDELSEELETAVITELESLNERFPKLQIVVTTRPETPVCFSAAFRVFRLARVEPGEISEVVARLTGDPDITANLLAAIRKVGSVKDILVTPLMITLLVITYKSYGAVPESLAEFYEQLVPLLLARHDQTKPGFVRKKTCGLNDHRIREVFETFCFTSKKRAAKPSFTIREAHESARTAAKACGEVCDEVAFIRDITKVTCLLLEEGGVLTFLHRSVQEFGCAAYLHRLSEESAKRFYSEMLTGKWHSWQVELQFLSEIDAFRFCRYFLLPDLQKAVSRLFKVPPDSVKSVSNEVALRVLEDNYVFVAEGKGLGFAPRFGNLREWSIGQGIGIWRDSRVVPIINSITRESVIAHAQPMTEFPMKGYEGCSFATLVKEKIVSDELVAVARNMGEKLIANWRKAEKFVAETAARESEMIVDL